MENEICSTIDSSSMQSTQEPAPKKWYSKGRWALALIIIGILILAFVIATGGEHGAWLLWFAVPFLMIGLGYFFIINALYFYWDKI